MTARRKSMNPILKSIRRDISFPQSEQTVVIRKYGSSLKYSEKLCYKLTEVCELH